MYRMKITKKHLWEIKHPYYCEEHNYYQNLNEEQVTFKSWKDFLEDFGEADDDYNFLFRWDWIINEDSEGNSAISGDPNYRDGELKLFFMGQRKGMYWSNSISVCQNDEKEIIKYLKKRASYMKKLWEPLL